MTGIHWYQMSQIHLLTSSQHSVASQWLLNVCRHKEKKCLADVYEEAKESLWWVSWQPIIIKSFLNQTFMWQGVNTHRLRLLFKLFCLIVSLHMWSVEVCLPFLEQAMPFKGIITVHFTCERRKRVMAGVTSSMLMWYNDSLGPNALTKLGGNGFGIHAHTTMSFISPSRQTVSVIRNRL